MVVVGGGFLYVFKPFSSENTSRTLEDPEIYYGSSETDFYNSTSSTGDYDTFASDVVGFNTFVDYYYAYQIDYPEDWYLEPAYDYTSFVSPSDGVQDTLYENFNIGVEDVSYWLSLTLEDYADASISQMAYDIAYTYQAMGYQSLGGYDGMYILGTYEIEGIIAGVATFFTLSGGNAYVVTYMYELPEKSNYREIMTHVLVSFELISNESARSKKEVAEHAESDENLGFVSLLHLGAP